MNLKSRLLYLIKWGGEYKNTIVTGLILLLVLFLGIGIGLLVGEPNNSAIIIDKNVKTGLPARAGEPTYTGLPSDKKEFSANSTKSFLSVQSRNVIGGNFLASINGKAYYPKDCKAANIIKEENRIWFESAAEAEQKGYALAKNCP